MRQSQSPKRSLSSGFAFLLILFSGLALHVLGWTLGIQTQCDSGSGTGVGINCDGGIGACGAVAAFAIAFLGSPCLVWLLLRHTHVASAGKIAWGAQLIAIPITLFAFVPLFHANLAGKAFLWEVITQGVVVPLAAAAIRRLTAP